VAVDATPAPDVVQAEIRRRLGLAEVEAEAETPVAVGQSGDAS
jgi:hypothetical protein